MFRPTLYVTGLVLVVALLGACGDSGSDELRSRDAASLRSAVDGVEQRVSAQDCTGAAQQAAALGERVDDLPESVDSDLRRALALSADRLESLVADQCAAEPAAPTEAPPVGTTSEDQAQGQDQNQTGNGKKDKKPKKEKPNPDQTQTETQPDTGGAGEEVPGVGDQGGSTPPGE